MKVPTLSIIIPTYNAEESIAATLNSIAKQEFNDYEVIIIDGVSSDKTLKEIDNVSLEIGHILSEKDNGIYDAMNKGVKLSKGEYLYFLGSNDMLADPWVLNEVFGNMNSEPKLIFGHIAYKNLASKKIPQVHTSSFTKKLIWKNSLHHQGAFYHKSIFEQHLFDTKYDILADYDLNLKLFKEGVSNENRDVIVAHCDGSGLSKEFKWKLYREEMKIKKSRLTFFGYLVQIPWIFGKWIYKSR